MCQNAIYVFWHICFVITFFVIAMIFCREFILYNNVYANELQVFL